ncbi:ABC transporter ATP-binding protein [Cumulibacter manganitolerans]|uniref:ABC transporter ATP-binding protein n=1 Tax=Cumulibacter manganitolerans TaxID=1884992 RepID=UPI001295F373|nr:ABC transporter ATP-binding protein [Cumulibacter manganitolerans]
MPSSAPGRTATATRTGEASSLKIEGLRVSAATDQGRLDVIEDVSLQLYPGKITGLAGESGSGKTVTALSIMQLLEPKVLKVEAGRALLGETDLLALRGKALRATRGNAISMVFQEPMTSLDPMFTVGWSISEVIRGHTGVGKAEAKRRTIELFEKVGIPHPEQRFNAYPFQMSGGQLQRVLIAMAVSCEPQVLIADEPTTALDVTVQAQIMRLLQQLAKEGMAVLLVTHDMGVISEYTDNLVVMYAGQVIESGTTREVIAAPQHPYTSGLLASVPSTRERLDKLPSIAGKVPLLHEMPPGCRFAPRCRFTEEKCLAPVPLAVSERGRSVRCVRADELNLEGVE